jgi:hypothetical protein
VRVRYALLASWLRPSLDRLSFHHDAQGYSIRGFPLPCHASIVHEQSGTMRMTMRRFTRACPSLECPTRPTPCPCHVRFRPHLGQLPSGWGDALNWQQRQSAVY